MTYPNLIPVLPELFMAFMIIVLLLADAFTSESQKGINLVLTMVTLVGCFVLQKYVDHGVTELTFNNMFILDNLAMGTKMFTYLFSFVAVLYIKRYVSDKKYQSG